MIAMSFLAENKSEKKSAPVWRANYVTDPHNEELEVHSPLQSNCARPVYTLNEAAGKSNAMR